MSSPNTERIQRRPHDPAKHQTVLETARPSDFRKLAAFRGTLLFLKKVCNSVERPICGSVHLSFFHLLNCQSVQDFLFFPDRMPHHRFQLFRCGFPRAIQSDVIWLVMIIPADRSNHAFQPSFREKSASTSDILICCGQTCSQLRHCRHADGSLSAGRALRAIGAINPPPV